MGAPRCLIPRLQGQRQKRRDMILPQCLRQHGIGQDQGRRLGAGGAFQHGFDPLRRSVHRRWPGGIKAEGDPRRRNTLERAAKPRDRDWPRHSLRPLPQDPPRRARIVAGSCQMQCIAQVCRRVAPPR